jgi:hypothetical protein
VTSHAHSKFGIADGDLNSWRSGFVFGACDLFVICDLYFGALYDDGW